MRESTIVALTTFFATIGPLDVAAMFAVLTANESFQQKFSIAVRGTLIATIILVVFALTGKMLLMGLGISLAAYQVGGGILLLLIGIDMAFARPSGAFSTTDEEALEASSKKDISVFPLATPLIAGPGAMGAAILLMANQEGNFGGQVAVLLSLLTILFLTFISLLIAGKILHLLGVIGMQVVTRIMGVLLSSLAVQFMFDGIRQSELF